MFGSIGGTELLVIVVIALVVFGPKRLPELGRTIGKGLREFRRASNDLKRSLEEEIALDERAERRRDLDDDCPRRPRAMNADTIDSDETSADPLPEMSLLEHLTELRRRVVVSLVALNVAMLA